METHFAREHREEVQRMWDNGEWVNQLGVFKDRTTPQKSMLERVPEVLSNTDSSPSRRWLIPLLDTLFQPKLPKEATLRCGLVYQIETLA